MTLNSMRVLLLSFVPPLLMAAAVVQDQVSPNGSQTLYSRRAAAVDARPGRPLRLISPNGKKALVAQIVEDPKDPDGMDVHLSVEYAGKKFAANLHGFNGEAQWAPDSRAFAITMTEGGGGLGSRVYVFYAGRTGMRKLDASRPIEKDFGSPVRCEVPVPPNTGFISWSEDSSRLLVAAEIVNVSVCTCKGAYRVYEINLPALTIAKTYSQTIAQKRFVSLMGPELSGANESCVQTLERHRARVAARPSPIAEHDH